jgi:hypothetical protein
MASFHEAFERVIQTILRRAMGFGAHADTPAGLQLQAVTQAYSQFLLDPRPAVRPAKGLRISYFNVMRELKQAAGSDAEALVRNRTYMHMHGTRVYVRQY